MYRNVLSFWWLFPTPPWTSFRKLAVYFCGVQKISLNMLCHLHCEFSARYEFFLSAAPASCDLKELVMM